MESRTLLLTAWMAPHSIISWEDAIGLLYTEKVDVLEEYDEVISSPSTSYFLPAVLRLRTAVASVKKGMKFSRVNVFTRDGFKCQYCGMKKLMKQLNYDHVLPRTQGGKTDWSNIVTCCYPCNTRKGGRTPEQAGMTLLRKPSKPHSLPLHSVYINSGTIPEPWRNYLHLSPSQEISDGIYLVGGTAALADHEGNQSPGSKQRPGLWCI